jgi:hypothetical protein
VDIGLLRRKPVGGVVLEKGLQQLKTSWFHAGDNRRIGALPLGKSGLVIWK